MPDGLTRKIKKVIMLNPRGRPVEVEPSRVSLLKHKGFTVATKDQARSYNPVYDRDEQVVAYAPHLEELQGGDIEVLIVDWI
jgi:hypothetical protein